MSKNLMILIDEPKRKEGRPAVTGSAGRSELICWIRSVSLLALPLLLVAAGAFYWFSRPRENMPQLHTVARGSFEVRSEFVATLVSEQTADIVCQVAAHRHPDGRSALGATVLWIVTDGQLVKEGDLLVEFDAALVRDLRDDWQLKSFKSEGHVRQVRLRCENAKSQRDTELANIATELEKLLEVKKRLNIAQQSEVSELVAAIELARQGAKVAELREEYVELFARMGLAGGVLGSPEEAKLAHEEQLKDLGYSVGELTRLSQYDHPVESQKVAAAAIQAHRTLIQTQRDYEAQMEQLTAERQMAERAFEREKQRLEYYEQQLTNCRVVAPFAGVVQLADPGDDEYMEPGIVLRERQKIMRLHSLTRLQLSATLQTAAAQYLERGMPASIEFDPLSGASCSGVVTAVTRDGTEYHVVVTPNEPPQLLPGATAKISILAKQCQDVLCVPIFSYFRAHGDTYCYVVQEGLLEQRPVRLGVIGREYAEVLDGLEEGDKIVYTAAVVNAGNGPN